MCVCVCLCVLSFPDSCDCIICMGRVRLAVAFIIWMFMFMLVWRFCVFGRCFCERKSLWPFDLLTDDLPQKSLKNSRYDFYFDPWQTSIALFFSLRGGRKEWFYVYSYVGGMARDRGLIIMLHFPPTSAPPVRTKLFFALTYMSSFFLHSDVWIFFLRSLDVHGEEI